MSRLFSATRIGTAILLALLILVSWPGACANAQTPQLSKEYIRLGGRVIAIENVQAAAPTASFTISKNSGAYTHSVTANVNDTITYQWSSTNGASYTFYDTISPGGADGCGNHTGSTNFTPPAGGTAGPYALQACQVGYTYTMVYTVTATGGAQATDTITITVSFPAPTGLTATAGNNQVLLNWTASAGATSYNVYRSTQSGNEGSNPYASGITGTAYTDSAAFNGYTYYYKIAAANGSAVSPQSGEVVAIPQGPPSAYSYRRALTVDHTKVPNTDQANFPVLVNGTYSSLATTANGGRVTNASGYDIVFTSDTACQTKLNYEVERWNPATGEYIAWVKLPLLSHTSDTVFYLCYGNSSISTDQSNRQGTWNSNFEGVWHFPNGTSLTANDSTSNGLNATSLNGTSATAGQAGGGATFNGTSNYIDFLNSAVMNNWTAQTVSLWVKAPPNTETVAARLIEKGANNEWTIIWNYGGPNQLTVQQLGSNGILYATSAIVADNTWHKVDLTISSTYYVTIYIDGVLDHGAQSVAPGQKSGTLRLGAYGGGAWYYTGAIDELKMSNIARSADWIATEYNNQRSPSTFYSFGSETALNGPDLTITKSHTGNFTQGQTGATYTITATNSGTAATSGTVTVTDTLPSSLTATAISGTGWTCTLSTKTCTRSNALAASSSYPAITLTVNVASNAPSSVTNTATVSGGGETNTTNDTANDVTTINSSGTPDLTVAKTHSGNFTQGQTGATYNIAVTNSGTGSTSGTVTVVDTLPSSLTATAMSGSGWTCTLSTKTCTRSNSLAASSSYPAITLTVNVASNAPSSVTNTATVSGGGETNTTNDTANDVTTINSSGTPDLTIAKTHSGNFTQGQTGATYTITATNSGNAATSGTVTVTDTLPSSLTATAMSGTGWACTVSTKTCTRSDALAVSSSYPAITLTVTVAPNAPSSVTNTAAVSGGGETNTTNDSASNATTITGKQDLTITKTHVGNFTQGQTGAAYTITVTNSGGAATSGTVTVTDTLPTSLTATAMSGTGWTCTLSSKTCTRSDALAASSSYPAITLTVNVASNAPSSVTNTATVSGGGETYTSNDTANDVTTITTGGPDLTIAKSHSGNFSQGQTGATYTITVTNSGNASTSGTVTVTDTLPASLTATAMSGTGWTCTLSTKTCTRSNALAASSSYPAITLTVNVASNAPASVTNTVAVSGGGETNTTNDTANDPTTITSGTLDLVLSNQTLSSGTTLYQATNSITAQTNFIINGTAVVTFRAGNYIDLKPGFDANSASGTPGTVTFHAIIGQ